MCGIIGYTGNRDVIPILVDGLRRLEYRGYDSAGVAVCAGGKVWVRKSVGRLEDLQRKLQVKARQERHFGIGHTRWATHGRPSEANAHPHIDCQGKFAVVHNGIIENYGELRRWLLDRGHEFRSETDTEVIPHLVEEYYEGSLIAAVRQAVRRLQGSYALAVIAGDHPGQIVAVRQDSPLIVGLGQQENFLASDIPAVLEYTRSIYILEDGELAVLTPDQAEVYTIAGSPVRKKLYTVDWDPALAQKGGYRHFMLKEIHEQPVAVQETMRGRIDSKTKTIVLDELGLLQDKVQSINKVVLIAAGTAFHAGLVAKHLFERLLRIPVISEVASELRYMDPMIDSETLALVISQSGETADTLAAMREARNRGAYILAVTNVVGSSVSREADDVLYTWAGPEIAVASTKAYTAQLVCLYLLVMYLGLKRGKLGNEYVQRVYYDMERLPSLLENIFLTQEERISELAGTWKNKENIFFIGRGIDYYAAMEGQLKLKEISYIHAEALAAGELKHGTLALIDEGVPVIAIATQPSMVDKTINSIKEVKARGAEVLLITLAGYDRIKQAADHVIELPQVESILMPILTAIPLQLLAYSIAVARGNDVDKPRNLAKSVTVE